MNKINSIITLFFCFLLLHSCTKKSETTYSCNKDLNQYVIDNLKSFNAINLEAINKYSIDTQRAIFNVLSHENKAELWHQKLDFIKSQNLLGESLNDKIDLLKELVTPELYDNKDKKDEINLFIKDHFISKIKNDTLLYYSFNRLTTQDYNSFVSANFEPATPVEKPTCGCDLDEGGYIKDCLIIDKCTKSNCIETTSGCGALYLASCDGMCK